MSQDEEDFAAMFEASEKARQFKRGQTVDGTIVAIGPKVALVNIGGKGEAELDVAELKDADGDIEVNVGDRITAMVVSTSGGIALSRKGVRNAATLRELEDAFNAGLAVEGKVTQAVKGGYEVRIARERAFCPLSQIDTARTEDPNVHVGKTYAFQVIEYKNGGKDVVLSRRKVLEAEQRASADEVRKTIVPGAVLTGRVASVREFGAFVELGGGIQGLLHVSEMGWTRVTQSKRDRRARRSDHRQSAPRRRGHPENLTWPETTAGRSVVRRCGEVRNGSHPQGPYRADRRLRHICRVGRRSSPD